MAFSLNKIMLIGNLGNDAETRFTTTNQGVTSFSLATTHSYKGKDGNWVNETTWHNVITWNCPDYLKDALKKGKKFYVEGRLSKRDYTDKDGVKRYVTEVVSERLINLESRENAGSGYSNGGGYSQPASGNEETSGDFSAQNEDDDLPF